jgi:hypothetical protein
VHRGWFRARLHQLGLGAVGTDDVFAIGDETSAYQGALTRGAHETVIVPVTILERDETGAANTW